MRSIFLLFLFISISYTSFFNTKTALKHIKYFSYNYPRYPGYKSYIKVTNYIVSNLKSYGYKIKILPFTSKYKKGVIFNNIEAYIPGQSKYIIFSSHYDSRLVAEKDENIKNRNTPIPGANDGGSSTGFIMEMARICVLKKINNIKFVFFDAEDNGSFYQSVEKTDWILGSKNYVKNINPKMIIYGINFDMIGWGKTIFKEKYSFYNSPIIVNKIWELGKKLKINILSDKVSIFVIDDHVPFINNNIKFIDIIGGVDSSDFIFPYHHTLNDTYENINKKLIKQFGKLFEIFLDNECSKG